MNWPWSSGKSAHRMLHPRGAERFPAVGLSCPLGDVLDLSATGLRVRFAGRPPVGKGESVTISIKSESQSVRVNAKVAWVRKNPLRGGQVGLQFVGVRPGIAAALLQLGRYGFISTDSATATGATPEPQAAPVHAAMEVEDLYALLGVEAGADEDAVRRAYHVKAKDLHPDRNPSEDAAVQFAAVSKAYHVLRSPSLRKRYDQLVAKCRTAA